MVDFQRHRKKKSTEKKSNPAEIYEQLDRISEKGELRKAQRHVLNEWYENRQNEKDVIVKLHTGQGKTLVGLLILQSALNQGNGPSLYLCPNKFLAEQTKTQARQFGIRYCEIDNSGIPGEFIDGKSILITHIQVLFNGLTKFGLNTRSEEVGTLVLDDAHSCINSIKKSFSISIPNSEPAYHEILAMFGTELSEQGQGDFADIKAKNTYSFLPIPYWAWEDKSDEVTSLLSKYSNSKFLKYTWPVIKNSIHNCLCLVSGSHIEISPYAPPLNAYGSYFNAKQRVFMSATINDDSFFLKALSVSPKAVKKPVIFSEEKWSGEKMILIPSLIDESLSKSKLVPIFANRVVNRKKGTAVLVPSFEAANLWNHNGAQIARTDDIIDLVDELKAGNCEDTIVFANRYDGIDLPDDACRTLIIDSKPYSEELVDRYTEQCRGNSSVIETRLAQTVEQGMGRHIRGEKDYGVIIILGSSLIKSIRSSRGKRFYSDQTRQQIDIGLKIAEFAQEEIEEGKKPLDALLGLMNQCLNRDEGWKDFYVDEMDSISTKSDQAKNTKIVEVEKKAEDLFLDGKPEKAVQVLQDFLDGTADLSDEDRGWYLQEMARYTYRRSKVESEDYQVAAHRKNRFLLKPRHGMSIKKLEPTPQNRILSIIGWIQSFSTSEELRLKIDEITDQLSFGVDANKFEAALEDLGIALGFTSERPDKQWGAGPDNLWCVNNGSYILFECKNQVISTRRDIYKDETGQMNNSCGWFRRTYPGTDMFPRMIIPAKELGEAANFNETVQIIKPSRLGTLRKNVKNFFQEFYHIDLDDIAESKVDTALKAHKLTLSDILREYSELPSR